MTKVLYFDPKAKVQEEPRRLSKTFRIVCDEKKFADGSTSCTVLAEGITDFHEAVQSARKHNRRSENGIGGPNHPTLVARPT